MNDNIAVRIVGDASGVAPAIDLTKSEIGSIAPLLRELNASMVALTGQMKAGFEAGAASATHLKTSVDSVNRSAHEAQIGLTGMVARIHEGAESVRTFQMRAKEFAEFYVALFAVEAIKSWAESLGEAAEKTAKLSAIMGMSIPQVQGLSAAALMSGTDIDMLSKAMAIFDSKAVTSAGSSNSAGKSFKAMGISANDGATNMERLLKTADKFHNMADGPTKTALAMQLFGKSGKEMVPFLNQGSVAIQQLIDKSKEYGVENEKAVEVGGRLAESVNESKIAWMGLKSTLTEAFGPMLTELVDGFNNLVKAMHDSYESGGIVKVIFEAIAAIGHGLVEVVSAIGAGFNEVFKSTSGAGVDWGAVITAVIDSVVVACKGLIVVAVAMGDGISLTFHLAAASAEWFLEKFTEITGGIRVAGTALGEFMQVVGKVCEDALTLHWDAIASDWSNGMEHVRQAVAAKANEVIGEAARMRKGVAEQAAAAAQVSASFDAFYKKMNGPAGAGSEKPFKFKFGGGAGDAPDITGSPKQKEKKPKDDLVQRLEQELEAKKTAWGLEQEAQGTAQAYSLQSEADFWATALQRTNLSAKDKLDIEKKWLAARQAIQKDQIAEQLEVYKSDIEEAGKNWTEKLAILKAEEAYITKMYGNQSKEAQAARDAVIKAEHEKADQLRQLADQVQKHQQDLALLDIDQAQAAAEQRVAMGQATQAHLLQQEKQFENQRHQIRKAALQADLALIDPNRDPAQYAKVSQQIETLEKQHQNKLTQLERQSRLERTKIERDGVSFLASSWASTISKMVTLQASFADTVRGLWQGLQQAVGQVIEQMLQKEIASILTRILFGKQEAAQSVATDVGKAGAGGVASMAAAPFPLNLTAPAFGASMAATAASMGSVAAFDVGAWNLSKDHLAVVHSGEMIIPSNMAGGMRNLFGAAANNNLPTQPAANSNGAGGDNHFHYSPTIQHHDTSLKEMLRTDGRDMRRWFDNQVRNGAIKPARD